MITFYSFVEFVGTYTSSMRNVLLEAPVKSLEQHSQSMRSEASLEGNLRSKYIGNGKTANK